MTINEGKSLLEECWKDCQVNVPMDDMICYKYGYLKQACNYHHDTIKTEVEVRKLKPTMKYVVKCFIYLEIYVAWPVEIGLGNGEYIAYKKDLIAMEANRDCAYQESLIERKGTACYFRGKEGITRFIRSAFNH